MKAIVLSLLIFAPISQASAKDCSDLIRDQDELTALKAKECREPGYERYCQEISEAIAEVKQQLAECQSAGK